ncbi:sugar-binding domain-containing protein [Agromyces sp. G08B096]|uniref:Sugar-binding domain-containing protein n=1 Tax=Agromyces sp. G08B096 TaxID=3156399 RepID=A0AAU7W8B0_9MICO
MTAEAMAAAERTVERAADPAPEPVLAEYPRPQLVRDSYLNLNGVWRYAITHADGPPVQWDGDILVPFSPESERSGVGRSLEPGAHLWYERELVLPDGFLQDRVLLHFGAVDQDCVVFVDGREVGRHVGGYLPFTCDITEAVGGGGSHVLRVEVTDDSDAGYASRGKQALKPGGIWYTPQSGIWQTVWLESVPAVHVTSLDVRPCLSDAAAEVVVHLGGGDADIEVVLTADGEPVARASGRSGELLRLELASVRPWSPEDPFLYDLDIRAGEDRVASYLGMRSVTMEPDADGRPRLMLNGAPYFHAGVLDQGYWPDGLYTAPSDEALVRDILAMKELGFTMLRKHIKIEPLRWYYHCDRLGMLVWQDLVNGGRRYHPLVITAPVLLPIRLDDRRHRAFGRQDAAGRAAFRAELDATVRLLRNHPSVAVWVPFNEGWGQFDALDAVERIRALDPDRLIDHASGWHDQGGGDIRSLHVYFRRIRARRSWGRDGRTVAVSEYGGYSLRLAGHEHSEREFGYRRYRSIAALTAAFVRLHRREVLPAIASGLSAIVYTQLSDVEDELNGLLTADRSVSKVDPGAVRAVNVELAAAYARAASRRG